MLLDQIMSNKIYLQQVKIFYFPDDCTTTVTSENIQLEAKHSQSWNSWFPRINRQERGICNDMFIAKHIYFLSREGIEKKIALRRKHSVP